MVIMNGTLYLRRDKSLLNPRVTPTLEQMKTEWGSGVCFREMLNKDNLENGLQHSAASVPPPPPLFPCTHTLNSPRAALLMFVLIWLPDSGQGGLEGDGVVMLEDLKDAWQWIRQIRAKTDSPAKWEGVMLQCDCRPRSVSLSPWFFFSSSHDTIDSWWRSRIPVVEEKSGEAVQEFSPGWEMVKCSTFNSTNLS